jgi:hypothetical protein
VPPPATRFAVLEPRGPRFADDRPHGGIMQLKRDLIAPLAIATSAVAAPIATAATAPKVLRVIAQVVDEYSRSTKSRANVTSEDLAILVQGIGDVASLALKDGMGVTSKEVTDNIRIIGGAGELSDDSGMFVASLRGAG